MKIFAGACVIRPFHILKRLGRTTYALTVLFLASCTNQVTQFATPEKITFQNQTFERVTHTQLDEMQQMLYLPSQSDKNPEQWDKGLLIFLDKNSAGQTLEQRAKLRTQSFAKQSQTQAKVEIKNNELRSEVIYPPTERFNNVQLEVSRGKELNCGFGQMQFADKRMISNKKLQNLSQFQPLVTQLAIDFSQLAWQIECQ